MPFDLAVSYTAPPPVWAVLHTAATASVRPNYTAYFFDVVDHPCYMESMYFHLLWLLEAANVTLH